MLERLFDLVRPILFSLFGRLMDPYSAKHIALLKEQNSILTSKLAETTRDKEKFEAKANFFETETLNLKEHIRKLEDRDTDLFA